MTFLGRSFPGYSNGVTRVKALKAVCASIIKQSCQLAPVRLQPSSRYGITPSMRQQHLALHIRGYASIIGTVRFRSQLGSDQQFF